MSARWIRVFCIGCYVLGVGFGLLIGYGIWG